MEIVRVPLSNAEGRPNHGALMQVSSVRVVLPVPLVKQDHISDQTARMTKDVSEHPPTMGVEHITVLVHSIT
jgi:hypothetical protein